MTFVFVSKVKLRHLLLLLLALVVVEDVMHLGGRCQLVETQLGQSD